MRIADAQLTTLLAWLRATAAGAQLSSDSRTIKRGDVFFAYPGDTADGRDYIAQAIANGAAAVVVDAGGAAWDEQWTVPHVDVVDLKENAGPIASAYYGRPDAGMFAVAVTGTNGKTSCTQWLGSAISRQGEPTVVVGTLGVGTFKSGQPQQFNSTGYTTPDAVMLQRTLAAARDAGATVLAIEASSIGLHQHRLAGLHVDVALFTNFTRDHLDYHGDMQAYEAAKTMLFDWPGLRHAVVNLDDAMGERLVRRLQSKVGAVPVIGYTLVGKQVDGIDMVCASDICSTATGTSFRIDSPYGAGAVKTRLIGDFNVSNVLGIIGVLVAKGMPMREAIAAAETLTPVPGRMQLLGPQDGPMIVIDYAHTPDALQKTLTSLRQVARDRGGQLWCLFGCGGDRDPGKRPQMGVIAMAADHVVVTSDNPRFEEPAAVIGQIVAGMDSAGPAPRVIEDRAAAILWTLRRAAKADVVLLAGKGHENYQEIKGRKLPFLDADHVALGLAARATMKGTG
ncbi:MAG: UDP-N-acetylmuramoyl-L-alanyl-D-glutamate--2,6-diaminopimelate ligase [Herminiimonas sp.]|nr:UDP-N-acetylmuramoyl-L-alanyl-D-glutamate--2,6-diaminopimelate ligase [Herminiimonas sp.]